MAYIFASGTRFAALISGLVIFTPPVMAQESSPPVSEESIFDGDYVTIGVGLAAGPSYEGSNDYVVSPLPTIIGSIAGIDFQPRGPGLAFDFVPDIKGAKVDFVFGPVIRARFDRNLQIKDSVVRSLGKLDIAVEVGPVAGVQINRLLNPFDSLTAQVDVRWDIAGAHDGMVVFPSLTYFTPLSRGAAVSLAISAEHVDDDYADYYYSISPAGNIASGLPVFNATGGWKNVGATLFGGIDLDGDLTNGGFGVFLLGGYSRILGDAGRSPITSIRGNANQWLGAIGAGYTF